MHTHGISMVTNWMGMVKMQVKFNSQKFKLWKFYFDVIHKSNNYYTAKISRYIVLYVKEHNL